jgi:hypothetical protein
MVYLEIVSAQTARQATFKLAHRGVIIKTGQRRGYPVDEKDTRWRIRATAG